MRHLTLRAAFLLLVLFLAGNAQAAQNGNVITPVGNNGYPIPAIQIGTSQNVSYNAAAGSSTQSSAFGTSTTLIAVAVNLASGTAGVRIAIAANPTASSSTTLIPASGVYFFAVQPGWKIAALSNDTNTGSINVTEATSWQ